MSNEIQCGRGLLDQITGNSAEVRRLTVDDVVRVVQEMNSTVVTTNRDFVVHTGYEGARQFHQAMQNGMIQMASTANSITGMDMTNVNTESYRYDVLDFSTGRVTTGDRLWVDPPEAMVAAIKPKKYTVEEIISLQNDETIANIV